MDDVATLGDFHARLTAALAERPDAPFLIDRARTWSFRDIDGLSGRIAGALAAAGVSPGDRIVAQVEKSPENVALYLAALRSGAVYTPLNTAYTDEERAFFLNDADPALYVGDPARAAPADFAFLTLSRDGTGSLIDAARMVATLPPVARRGDDLAAILYTSGTTGRSKGAMLTNDNLRTNAEALVAAWDMSDSDTLLHALPIFHIHGLFVALNAAMLAGTRVLFHRAFDPAAVARDLAQATVMMGVPTFYARLLREPTFDAVAARAVRIFISGSAPLTSETFTAFEERTGQRILERYGMSEAGIITSNPLTGDRVAGTVGFPLPGVRIRIADGDATGEVEVAGDGVFAGYWRNGARTAEAFTDDGWFRTGDIGAIDDSGRLSLVGRAKDLIIVGGYNVYAKEIEEILDAAAAIAESAVVGAPHADMGEGVVAFLVGAGAERPDDDELAAIIAPLAKFKRPRRFIWLDELPRNAMGKVGKEILRERCKDAFR
ncbi:MAG: AMP-binding protein [Alphaproteobacteria bacterium]|nr:AMP-binding protein [Alphaproteobacteria bacterium]